MLIGIMIFFVYTKSYSQSKERINYVSSELSTESAYGISLKDWRTGVLYLNNNTKLFGSINYNNYFEIVRIKINDNILSYGINSISYFRQLSQDNSYKTFIPIYEFDLNLNKEIKKKDKFYEVIYIGSIFLLRKSYVIDFMSNSFIYKDIYYLWKPNHGLVKLPVTKYKYLRELFNKKYHRDLKEKFGKFWLRNINYRPRILARLIVYYNNLIDPDVVDKNIKFLYEEI